MVRFSNLLERLLTRPVLQRKSSLLHLLDLLADSSNNDGQVRPQDSIEGQFPHGTYHVSVGGNDLPPPYRDRPASGGTLKPSTHRERQRPNSSHDRMRESESTAAGIANPESGETSGSLYEPSKGNPAESEILRELPFTLQGVSSNNLQFESSSKLRLPNTLPLPIVSLLHTLAEPSLLYRQLSDFVQSDDDGLIRQSLKAAISIQLREYLSLITTLEGEIRRALTTVEREGPGRDTKKANVTLKRCVIYTRDATMALRLMSLMVEESKCKSECSANAFKADRPTIAKKGCRLISTIHGFSSSHGDPFVGDFAGRILDKVTRPFYDILQRWIYDGELSDPYHEFFVLEQDPQANDPHHTDPRRAPAINVWEDKYRFEASMIPSIITHEFAHKVFLIGKSLNFIRHSCNDSAWVEAYRKSSSQSLAYTASSDSTLSTSIDIAYRSTMSRLIYLMNNKFNLSTHLLALKKYLLLSQGDFIALLMESLAQNLDAPAKNQYRHTLTAQLEHAIRGSNAQYEPEDVLRRLDARLVELSQGDVGWDVFTLEYKVDAPVDVVITPWAGKQYLIIFNLLWRVKRVEFSLGSCWCRAMTGARGVLSPRGSSVGTNPELARAWKAARGVITEMIHFVNQLQYYFLFEVIESSWTTLQSALEKPDATLDDLIGAHARYLTSITRKGLLGKNAAISNREEGFTAQLHEILKLMLNYRDVVEGLYSFSVAEFSRQQARAARIDSRTAAGKWGTSDADEMNSPSPFQASDHPILASLPGLENTNSGDASSTSNNNNNKKGSSNASLDEDTMLSALRKRMSDLGQEFKKRVEVLLGDLLVQPDADMKFLGVVMNFNDTYVARRRRRHQQQQQQQQPQPRGEKDGGEEKKTPAAANNTVPATAAKEDEGGG